MRTFARIQDGLVVERFGTTQDIETLFNPALLWIDVSDTPAVAEGWTFDGRNFAPPAVTTAPPTPSLAELDAELQALTAKIEALSG